MILIKPIANKSIEISLDLAKSWSETNVTCENKPGSNLPASFGLFYDKLAVPCM